jgi:hypothetical protein
MGFDLASGARAKCVAPTTHTNSHLKLDIRSPTCVPDRDGEKYHRGMCSYVQVVVKLFILVVT